MELDLRTRRESRALECGGLPAFFRGMLIGLGARGLRTGGRVA